VPNLSSVAVFNGIPNVTVDTTKRQSGVGNWLSMRQAQAVLNAPDASTGGWGSASRDTGHFALAAGRGVRRLRALTLGHILQRTTGRASSIGRQGRPETSGPAIPRLCEGGGPRSHYIRRQSPDVSIEIWPVESGTASGGKRLFQNSKLWNALMPQNCDPAKSVASKRAFPPRREVLLEHPKRVSWGR
jgi:hypothetical protein